MSIESVLRRELGIRFIDARELAVEARIRLALSGYPSEEERLRIEHTACDLFRQRSPVIQETLRANCQALDDMKNSLHETSLSPFPSFSLHRSNHDAATTTSSPGGARRLRRHSSKIHPPPENVSPSMKLRKSSRRRASFFLPPRN